MTENTRDLLIEIGCEEIPAKSLLPLAETFQRRIIEGLRKANIACGVPHFYATPRRIALLVNSVAEIQPAQRRERRGPVLQAAFNQDGSPSKAALGFARSCGVEVEQLRTLETEKGSWLTYTHEEPGHPTVVVLPDLVKTAIDLLPIQKKMRWGSYDDEFIRPVRWLLLLLGHEVVQTRILGATADNRTYGHRFHRPDAIAVLEAEEYAERLRTEGKVIADFVERKRLIRDQVEHLAEGVGGKAVIEEELLDEVTALVEWPVAMCGGFEERFLDVPHEVLISTMKDHQKYFPVVDSDGKLMPHFISVANIESKHPEQVRAGNERVIRPRFSDAEFFWQQDLKQPLEHRIEALKKVVFQRQLGSLFDKSERIASLCRLIAERIGGDKELATRAAKLCKCDLLSQMVVEFPDLQGIMGRYYAQSQGEPDEVSQALEEQYRPRFAGDSLPQSVTGRILALADRIDTLVAIFAIGQAPTGTKDPFALRRAALGVIRITIECELELDLRELLVAGGRGISSDSSLSSSIDTDNAAEAVYEFVLERLRGYYLDQDVRVDTFEAVVACRPLQLVDFDRRVHAVEAFRKRPEAESLSAANKRIRNILKQVKTNNTGAVKDDLLVEPAECELASALASAVSPVSAMFDSGNYTGALARLAGLRDPVDRFFDHVMVMADDEALRNNRLALLNTLSDLFLRAADFSRLQT